MPETSFDLYRTADGYAVVANDVRRRILRALAEDELGLPGLVEATGRSKPTLSAVHMRVLADDGLVEVRPHPTDGRRKIYTLAARRLASTEDGQAQVLDRLEPLDEPSGDVSGDRDEAAV